MPWKLAATLRGVALRWREKIKIQGAGTVSRCCLMDLRRVSRLPGLVFLLSEIRVLASGLTRIACPKTSADASDYCRQGWGLLQGAGPDDVLGHGDMRSCG